MTRAARALVRRLEREVRYLTRAERLAVSRRTLFNWIQADKFPSHDLELGGVKRWRLSTVAAWETERMRGAA